MPALPRQSLSVSRSLHLAKLTLRMACPVCGKTSPCAHETTRLAVLLDTETTSSSSTQSSEQFWRQEVISRVQQHKARRRKRGDDGSLELDFQPEPVIEPEAPTPPVVRTDPPKIIRFPRPVPVQAVPVHPEPLDEMELAEPVIDTPRILEAPEPVAEQMNLLPTFDDIQLEAESYRPHSLELPLQPAPMQQRAVAGGIDLGIVLAAAAVFVVTFVLFAKDFPQARTLLLCTLLTCGALWLVYQYLFLVYAGTTPGMKLAQLELCTFAGGRADVNVRRWRAFASLLSGCSLGLGFAWALIDEDRLGWHDRITQTHLRATV